MDDMMPRVAKMLSVVGSTLEDVRNTLKSEGVSEYDIYLTVKGAAMCYPHVAEAVADAIPDTLPSTT